MSPRKLQRRCGSLLLLLLLPLLLMQQPQTAVEGRTGPQTERARKLVVTVTECRSGAELAAAMADQGVLVARLLADITLTNAAFAGLPQPIIRQHSFSVVGVGELPPIVDFGFVRHKIRFVNGTTFKLDNIVMRHYRDGSQNQAPGLDILAPTLVNESAVLRQDHTASIYYWCFPEPVLVQAALMIRRPPEVPGNNTYNTTLPWPSNCTNSTTAHPYLRCWVNVGRHVDIAGWGNDIDPLNGRPVRSGYLMHVTDNLNMCEAVLSMECVMRHGPLGCLMLMLAAVPPFPPPSPPPMPPLPLALSGSSGRARGTAGDGGGGGGGGHSGGNSGGGGGGGGVGSVAMDGGSGIGGGDQRGGGEERGGDEGGAAGGGGGGAGQVAGVVVGAVAGGLLLLALGAAAFLSWRRQQRQQRQQVDSTQQPTERQQEQQPKGGQKQPGEQQQQQQLQQRRIPPVTGGGCWSLWPLWLRPSSALVLHLYYSTTDSQGRPSGDAPLVHHPPADTATAASAATAAGAAAAGVAASATAADAVGARGRRIFGRVVRKASNFTDSISTSRSASAAAAAALPEAVAGPGGGGGGGRLGGDASAHGGGGNGGSDGDGGANGGNGDPAAAAAVARRSHLPSSDPTSVTSATACTSATTANDIQQRLDDSADLVTRATPARRSLRLDVQVVADQLGNDLYNNSATADAAEAPGNANSGEEVLGNVPPGTGPASEGAATGGGGGGGCGMNAAGGVTTAAAGAAVMGERGRGEAGGCVPDSSSGEQRGESNQVRLVPDAARGAGAFGRVVEGVYQGQRVAVKLVADTHQWAGPPEALIRTFVQEVEVLGRCQHPNVVRLLAACLTPPRLCLVLELMETSLDVLMYGIQPRTHMPLTKALHIGVEVARALAYLHPTVLHRDLKPGNILLNDPHSDCPGVKVTDFGLSRLRSTVLVTDHPDAGTPGYMAPECYDVRSHRAGIITHQADVFSLGVVLWEMLATQRPWRRCDPIRMAFSVAEQRLRPSLASLEPQRCPPQLADVITQCWEHDPLRRPAAAEVQKSLELILQDVLSGSISQGGVAVSGGGGAAAAVAVAAGINSDGGQGARAEASEAGAASLPPTTAELPIRAAKFRPMAAATAGDYLRLPQAVGGGPAAAGDGGRYSCISGTAESDVAAAAAATAVEHCHRTAAAALRRPCASAATAMNVTDAEGGGGGGGSSKGDGGGGIGGRGRHLPRVEVVQVAARAATAAAVMVAAGVAAVELVAPQPPPRSPPSVPGVTAHPASAVGDEGHEDDEDACSTYINGEYYMGEYDDEYGGAFKAGSGIGQVHWDTWRQQAAAGAAVASGGGGMTATPSDGGDGSGGPGLSCLRVVSSSLVMPPLLSASAAVFNSHSPSTAPAPAAGRALVRPRPLGAPAAPKTRRGGGGAGSSSSATVDSFPSGVVSEYDGASAVGPARLAVAPLPRVPRAAVGGAGGMALAGLGGGGGGGGGSDQADSHGLSSLRVVSSSGIFATPPTHMPLPPPPQPPPRPPVAVAAAAASAAGVGAAATEVEHVGWLLPPTGVGR